jgi:hypothetical protein
MRNLQKDSYGVERKTFKAYPDEMFFIKEYKDEITMQMNEFCFQEFGTKPRISENYIYIQSPPKADDEVFRWTFCCDEFVFIVSLIKKELVYWKHDSVLKEKNHRMLINSRQPLESIAEFIRCIALYRPNCDELPE